MKQTAKLFLYLATVLVVTACKESGEDLPVERVITGAATDITPFGATLSGTVNTFSTSEMSRGSMGFLYTTDADENVLLFESYANTGETASLKRVLSGGFQPGGIFSVTINNLEPEQTIYYCAFFDSPDGEYHIGKPQVFSTSAFSPQLADCVVSNISYYKATVSAACELGVDQTAASGIVYGFVISKTESPTLTTGTMQQASLVNGKIKVDLSGLSPSSVYYCRAFIKVGDKVFYGNETAFPTRDLSEMEVDLGLSVKWANCDLGASDFKEIGDCFTWGTLSVSRGYSPSTYPHYDSATNSYSFIGTDIAGSEYDVAKARLGGKWRMPTVEEVRELMSKCIFDYEEWEDRDTIKTDVVVTDTDGNTFTETVTAIYVTQHLAFVFKGTNGKKVKLEGEPNSYVEDIDLITSDDETYYSQWSRWTSGYCASDDYKAAAYHFIYYYLGISSADRSFLTYVPRNWALAVRPVCDY